MPLTVNSKFKHFIPTRAVLKCAFGVEHSHYVNYTLLWVLCCLLLRLINKSEVKFHVCDVRPPHLSKLLFSKGNKPKKGGPNEIK